jgi:hypothetical protein
MAPKASDEGETFRTSTDFDACFVSNGRPLIRPLRGHLLPLRGRRNLPACTAANLYDLQEI